MQTIQFVYFGSICTRSKISSVDRNVTLPAHTVENEILLMLTVHRSAHFEIVVPERPHVTRRDGGHLIINPKVAVEDRTHLTREQAIELVKLTMVVGEAMKTVLTRSGIPIGRINYQDNGNWRHELHVHLYGRSRDATIQPWGTFLQIPPTRETFNAKMGNLEPLNADDARELGAEIERLLGIKKYREFS